MSVLDALSCCAWFVCGARRMSQTAAHLVDHVIRHVPVRPWVLSLPIPLRLLLATQPFLVTPVLQVVHRVITRPALANERGQCNAAGQVVPKLKTAWRDGTAQLVMSPLEFMQRLRNSPRPGQVARAAGAGAGRSPSIR